MRYILLFAIIISILFVGIACNKDKQADIDRDLIENYISENNIDAQSTEEGVYYIITQQGTSEEMPVISDEVEVKYKGYLLDGTVFDQTMGSQTFSSPLTGLIQGWQIGIPLIQKGGKATLIIPSELGYGSRAVGTIPANSVLVFEIELIDF